MLQSKKGFSLIEMLLVIAVIAILVAIAFPNFKNVDQKAQAAADAANLRSVLSSVNVQLSDGKDIEDIAKELKVPESEIVPGAKLLIYYVKPVSLNTFYVKDEKYYDVNYLSDLALYGKSDVSLAKPLNVGFWYEAGFGKIN